MKNYTDLFELDSPTTKRKVLSVISKVYDPLGLIAPVTIVMKALFQLLCKDGIDWDQQLSNELYSKVMKWKNDLEECEAIQISRCFVESITDEVKTVELLGFGDASTVAYAAVVYIRTRTATECRVQLVTCKTRVAPLAKQSVARLELLSATILARLMTSVREALIPVVEINAIYCWLDSLTAIYWIRGEEREWKPFVQNRVMEIRKLVPSEFWFHCSLEQHIADIVSRRTKATDLLNNDEWWNGPFWVRNYSSVPIELNEPTPDVLHEARASHVRERVSVRVHVSVIDETSRNISEIISCEDHNSVSRLYSVTAYVLRFVENLKRRRRGDTLVKDSLTAQELENAEHCWLLALQKQVRSDSNYDQIKNRLGLFEDDKRIIRCKGRLANAQITYEERYPAIIPKNHHLTTLIIRDCHHRVGHNGIRETLAEVRSRFWIEKGRQTVRNVITKCVICRRFEGPSYPDVIPSALPASRVSDDPAFTYVGVDFAGPLYVKGTPANKEGSLTKVYLTLFTCASSRAVHLDLVPELSTQAFIRCFHRFTARRGIPREMFSDNALTFKAASRHIASVLRQPEVKKFLSLKRIIWKFNLPRAPWWGGFFERMIKCVKRCLKKILGTAKLSYDELLTVVIDVEL